MVPKMCVGTKVCMHAFSLFYETFPIDKFKKLTNAMVNEGQTSSHLHLHLFTFTSSRIGLSHVSIK